MRRPDRDVLLADFLRAGAPSREAYARLFAYFLDGFLARRSRCGALAVYPGMISNNGALMDRLEGFSRIAPLLGAWLFGGRPARVDLEGRPPAELAGLLRAGILAGTDPSSADYWGEIGHRSQAIVEAADIALTLWLSRPQVWDGFSAAERTRIVRWLNQVNGKQIPDNNWHLFVAQVNAVLAALGETGDASGLRQHYLRAKSFHRGEGWFQDGDLRHRPGFDYYNAWGFHYHLQWLARIAPDLDGEFIDAALRGFVTTYKCFFGPAGFPIMGRSACYRLAAPAPLIFAQRRHPDLVSPGEARRAMDLTWQFFVGKGAVSGGNVTQGYYGADPRLLENYSGPASCLWSLRSLIAAFSEPAGAPFWLAAPEPLPVEREDFELRLAVPGWTLTGTRRTAEIVIATGHPADPPLERHRIVDRVIEIVTRRPRRPRNVPAKYCRSRYSSSEPFGEAP